LKLPACQRPDLDLGGHIHEARDGGPALFDEACAITFAHQDRKIHGARDEQRSRHHQRDLSRQAVGQELHSRRTSAANV
jgi:hypothetical protein